MTRRDEILIVLRWFLVKHGYSPTVREIAELMELSAATVQAHINRLLAEGRVTHEAGKPRTLRTRELF